MTDDESKRPRRARPKHDDAAQAQAEMPRKKRRRAAVDGSASAPSHARVVDEQHPPADPPKASPSSAASVERPLVASAVAAAVGLAIVGTGASSIGPWVLAAGVIGLVASIHRLGRLGPA